jgi:hypothetical protein
MVRWKSGAVCEELRDRIDRLKATVRELRPDPVDFRECFDGDCHNMVLPRMFVDEWLLQHILSDADETAGMLVTRLPHIGFLLELQCFPDKFHLGKADSQHGKHREERDRASADS